MPKEVEKKYSYIMSIKEVSTVSILSTFYVQFFCTKVFLAAFLCLESGLKQTFI
jgi:hypothetical protein